MSDELQQAVTDVIGAQVRAVFEDAAQFRQVQNVLRDWLKDTAGAAIVEIHPGIWVVIGKDGQRLHKSHSYAGCLEWVLTGEQPAVQPEPEEVQTLGGKRANVLRHGKKDE
jgi:hypothetical protein